MSAQQPLSPWNYKPWWCQPWSILLTGIALIGGSWFLGKILWVTVLVAIPVLAWMGFFLLIWPQLMQQSGLLNPPQSSIPEGRSRSDQNSDDGNFLE